MRQLKRLPKPIIKKNISKTKDETPILGPIKSDFEAEYQAFIQKLKSIKEKNEKVTEPDNQQDIQSNR